MNAAEKLLGAWVLDDPTARWAEGLVAGVRREYGDLPRYGDEQWQQAPPSVRLAAAVAAAEAGRRALLDYPQRALDEARWAQALKDAADHTESVRVVRAVVAMPTHDELLERRAFVTRLGEVA
ncbi:MAG: hypothetical protein Q8R60_08820 [Mycobacteriales bacterium]|nr:hypothetical protein [Mycobacteriales bacterium]